MTRADCYAAGALVVAVVVPCVLWGTDSGWGEALGVMAVLICPVLAVVAGIAGASSLIRMRRSRERRRALRRGIFGLAVAVGALLVCAGALLPALGRAREEARCTQCRRNLRQIASAIEVYAENNGGWTPAIHARAFEIAHGVGLPGGSIVAFRDRNGQWKASGFGLLVEGGYLSDTGPSALYCPSTSGEDPKWVCAFSLDPDDWRPSVPGPADGDGVGELPGNPSVMLSSYVLRSKVGVEWGAWKWNAKTPRLASDLFPFAPPGTVRNHRDRYIAMRRGGEDHAPGGFSDPDGRVSRACSGAKPDEIEKIVDEIFEQYLDPLWCQ